MMSILFTDQCKSFAFSAFLLLSLTLSLIPAVWSDCTAYQSTNPLTNTEKWRVDGSVNVRHTHTAVNIDEENVVLFGGVSASSSRKQVADDKGIHVYNTVTNTVQSDSPTVSFDGSPQARFGQTSWPWKGSMYVFGGFVQNYMNDMWRLDYQGFVGNNLNSTWRQVNASASSSITPTPVYGHTTTLIHTSNNMQVLLSFGGTTVGGTAISELSLLQIADTGALGACDPSLIPPGESCSSFALKRTDTESTWSTPDSSLSSSFPSPRSSHAASSPSGSFCTYVYGGLDPASGDIFGDLWRVCPNLVSSVVGGDSVSWSTTKFIWEEITISSSGFMPTPRFGHIMAELGAGRLLVHGGSGEWPNLFMENEAEFDVSMGVWLAIAPSLGSSSKVRGHASTVVNGTKLIYFGGEDENGDIRNEAISTNYSSVACNDGFATIFCTTNSRVVCQPCIRGTFAVAGDYTCTSCDSGKYAPLNESSSCELCGRGEYGDGSVGAWDPIHCIKCGAGKSSNVLGAGSESACSICGEGTYSLTGWWNCSFCEVGKSSPAQSSSCGSCLAGTYSGFGAASCTDCSPGKYSSIDEAVSCQSCLAGTYSGLGATSCTNCAAGKFSAGSEASSCSDCGGGKYQESEGESSCDLCGIGKASASIRASNSSVCIDCNPGYHAPSLGQSSCNGCIAGRYQASLGMPSCDLCGYGKYSTALTATSESTCVDCPVGRFTALEGNDDLNDCDSCPPGKYSIPIVGLGCRECERGRYSTTYAMAQEFECALCDRNTYSGSIGSTSCISCPSGTYSHLGYATCIDCSTTKSSSSNVEHYEGSLQGFYLQDEVMVGWGGGSSGDNWVIGAVGPLGGSTEVYEQSASDVEALNATVELWFEGMMPLVLRGFGKPDGVTGEASLALMISVDAVTFEEVLVVNLDVSQDGIWQYVEEIFHPTPSQIAKTGRVEIRSSSSSPGSTVQWVGVGLFNHPLMSCLCTDGYYMNLDTPNCRTCDPQPSCRSDYATCYRCPAGMKCGAGVIQGCETGRYSWGGERDCSDCEAGWICENGLTMPCAAEGGIEDDNVCGVCPQGYNCRNGVKEICPPGTYSLGGGGRGGKQCINCEPGKFSGGGSNVCDLCPAGKTSGYGHEDCYDCPRDETTWNAGDFPCVSL